MVRREIVSGAAAVGYGPAMWSVLRSASSARSVLPFVGSVLPVVGSVLPFVGLVLPKCLSCSRRTGRRRVTRALLYRYLR